MYQRARVHSSNFRYYKGCMVKWLSSELEANWRTLDWNAMISLHTASGPSSNQSVYCSN